LIKIATDYSFKGTSEKIACSYQDLMVSVKIGGAILMADGEIVAEVTEILEVK
jgi:pyruvate kinase